jgi:molybdate transport system regulatory protein
MSASSKVLLAKRAIIIPRYRMYRGKEIVLGPGKAELLQHIVETGSISEAARLMGMSYNRAWLHVKVMNESFKEPLVHSSRGGHEHGGAELTETGAQVLKLYRDMEQDAAKATKGSAASLQKLVKG